jgi:hypothetical protein
MNNWKVVRCAQDQGPFMHRKVALKRIKLIGIKKLLC